MDIYQFTLLILVLLAITDLTVGVANDAVNFLNAGVGSRVASFKKILFVSAIGIFVGVLFASGMMDVAKSGIFDPHYFTLSDVLQIFVAVMFTDLLLLDLFNTYGLPTSTTVSVISSMLGSAFMISLVKILDAGAPVTDLSIYLNIASIFKIFSAILISIAVAFIAGFTVQYFTRMIFTFDYKPRLKKYGALWGGFSLTVLSYFILMKGIKSAAIFAELGVTDWMLSNVGLILIGSFVFWAIFFQILMFVFKEINILKFIVFLGTFSLSLSFAANDLVNFIGPTLASVTAYIIALSSGDINNVLLGDLATSSVQAETWMLLIAGAVMVATLYFSKKTKSVIQTSVVLGRQSEGDEDYDSNGVARAIVRMVIAFHDFLMKITPISIQKFLSSRFDLSKYKPEIASDGTVPAFDLLRASVILIVSSGLISFATSLKLPLSTTYVTFIVAMAAALPDKSWGRDSAVYRVAGVLTVIAGWFFTAFMAALMAAIIASVIYYGELYGLLGMVLFTGFILVRTHRLHKKIEKEKNFEDDIDSDLDVELETSVLGYSNKSLKSVVKSSSVFLNSTMGIVINSYRGLVIDDLKVLKKSKSSGKKLNKKLNSILKKTFEYIRNEGTSKNIELKLLSLNALSQDIIDKAVIICEQNYSYLDNNHNKLLEEQLQEVMVLSEILEEYSFIVRKAHKYSFSISEEEISAKENKILKLIAKYKEIQLDAIKTSNQSIKRTTLIINILNDIEQLSLTLLKVIRISMEIKTEMITTKGTQSDSDDLISKE